MTSDLRQSILDLIRKGLTDNEIATRLRITRNSVIGHRHRAEIACNQSNSPFSRLKHPDGRKFPNWKGGIGAKAAEPKQSGRGCRYVHGDPRAKWRWCDKPVDRPGGPYCTKHWAMTHVRYHRPEEANEAQRRTMLQRRGRGALLAEDA